MIFDHIYQFITFFLYLSCLYLIRKSDTTAKKKSKRKQKGTYQKTMCRWWLSGERRSGSTLRGAESGETEQESSKFLTKVRGRDPELARMRKMKTGEAEMSVCRCRY